MKIVRTGMLAILALFVVSACHTVAGVGKDITKGAEHVGDKIDKELED